MTLEFTVRHQCLKLLTKKFLASRSVKYLYAKFNFSEDWANTTKTVVFYNKRVKEENGKTKIFNVLLSNDVCYIPWEVIEKNGEVSVGVFGMQGEDKIIDTNFESFCLKKGAYLTGDSPKPPTPDIYQQILDMIANIQPGTDNYNDLRNKPIINDITLIGNRNLAEIPLTPEEINILTP